MKWLEIISLRTSGPSEKEAGKYMKEFAGQSKQHHLSDANFYVHAFIPCDLALFISSQTQEGKDKGTYQNVYMADVLKQFGLLDYNCFRLVQSKVKRKRFIIKDQARGCYERED